MFKRIQLKRNGYLKQVLVGLFCITLALSFGAPSTFAKDKESKPALEKALKKVQKKTVPPLRSLSKAIRDNQFTSGKGSYYIKKYANESLKGLKVMKSELEDVAKLVEQFDETAVAFYGVVMDYYQFLGLVYTAREAYSNIGISYQDLKDYHLVFPVKTASWINQIQASASRNKELDSFNTAFIIEEVKGGKVRLFLAPRETFKFGLAGLVALPSKKAALDKLKYHALTKLFTERALLQSFLYREEQKDLKLSNKTRPSLLAAKSNAEMMVHEKAYRTFMSDYSALKVVRYVNEQWNNKKDKLEGFFKTLRKKYKSKINTSRATDGFKTYDAWASHYLTMMTHLSSGTYADRAILLDEYMKNDPVKITMLGKDELKEHVARNMHFIDAFEFMKKYLGIFVFGTDKKCPLRGSRANCFSAFTKGEEAQLDLVIYDFVKSVIKGSELPDKAVYGYMKDKKVFDRIVSFKRYSFADALINMVRQHKTVMYYLDKSDGVKKIPWSWIPANPDPGLVIKAIADSKSDYPAWAMEALEVLVKGVSEAKDQNAREKLWHKFKAGIKLASDIAKNMNSLVVTSRSSIPGQVKKAHKTLKFYRPYQWHGTQMQINKMQYITWGDTQGFLKKLSQLGKLAEFLQAPTLAEYVANAFKGALDGDMTAADRLYTKVRDGKYFLIKHPSGDNKNAQSAIKKLFQNASDRNNWFKEQLEDPDVYQKYGAHVLNEYNSSFPGMFLGIKLPKKLAEDAGYDDRLSLYDLIAWVVGEPCPEKQNCKNGALAALAGADTDWIKYALRHVKTRYGKKGLWSLAKKEKMEGVDFTPRELLLTATRGNDKVKKKSGLLNWVLSFWVKRHGPSDEKFWPAEDEPFKVRDFFPAKYAFNKEFKGMELTKRAQRAVISALITPFFRSALEINASSIRLLLGNKKKSYAKMLVQSNAYTDLVQRTDTSLKKLFKKVEGDALATERKWKKRQAWLQTYLEPVSHAIFFPIFFIPNPKVHMLAFPLFITGAVTGLTTETALFAIGQDSLREVEPFSGSSVFAGQGLFDQSKVDAIRTEVNQRAEIISMRFVMDFWLISMGPGFFKGAYLSTKFGQRRWQKAHQRREMALQQDYNYTRAVNAMKLLGLEHVEIRNLDVSTLKKAYRQTSRENHPDFAQGAEAKAERTEAMKGIKEANELLKEFLDGNLKITFPEGPAGTTGEGVKNTWKSRAKTIVYEGFYRMKNWFTGAKRDAKRNPHKYNDLQLPSPVKLLKEKND